MLETSVRLLRLLSLLQARPDWSGAELADRLAVTTRTVRNDIERLRILGYQIHSSTGTAGGYRLGAGAALPTGTGRRRADGGPAGGQRHRVPGPSLLLVRSAGDVDRFENELVAMLLAYLTGNAEQGGR